MDLKGKLKTFIDQKKSNKKPVSHVFLALADTLSVQDFEGHLAISAYETRSNFLPDEVVLSREAEDVLIDTIEEIYFDSDGPDVGSYELMKFPDIADIHVITGTIFLCVSY